MMNLFTSIDFCVAQTYADDESHGANLTCIACVVTNAGNAVDADENTYSTVSLTVGVGGAYVYQRLQFPAAASHDEYVSIVVEGPSLEELNESSLACLELTTYNNGVSNNDTKVSSQYTIQLLTPPAKYIVKMQPSSTFDEVQLKLVAGTIGALTQLRIYYSIFSDTPLPVELLYFKGIYTNPANTLEWSTASETQNDFFTIEKSANGIDFEELLTVKGAGTSTARQVYHFNDENPFVGSNFYRLKQTDMNGQYQYSSIISIHAKCIGVNQFAFGPNPMIDYLNLFYGSDENCFVDIKIVGMDGYEVYNTTLESKKGLNVLTINDLGNLSPGMYNLYIISSNERICKRLVKI